MATTPVFTSAAQLAEAGQKIYRERWQSSLEPARNGEFAAIDVVTGNAVVAEEPHEALKKAMAANPESFFHIVRIGFPAGDRLGFSLSNASSRRLH